jgi:peptide/nickel transport system substrate-binding protein
MRCPRPFDLARATAILDGAGWVRGADGIRTRKSTRLELQFVLGAASSEADRVVELIRAWSSKIAIALNVKHYPSSALFAPYEDRGIIFRGAFDVAYFNVGVDAFGDFSTHYTCDQIPPAGQNDLRWCSRRATAAMYDLFRQYTPEGRRRDDAILMAELRHDVPTIITLIPNANFIFNSDLRGFHRGAITSFDNMMNVDI